MPKRQFCQISSSCSAKPARLGLDNAKQQRRRQRAEVGGRLKSYFMDLYFIELDRFHVIHIQGMLFNKYRKLGRA